MQEIMNMYKRLSRLSPCKECVFVCVWVCLGTQKAGKHSRSLSCPTSPPTTPPPGSKHTSRSESLDFFSRKSRRKMFLFFFWKVTIRRVSGHCRRCLYWIEASPWCTGKFPKTKNKAYFVLMAKHQLWRNWLVWKHQYDETIKKKTSVSANP